jgi:tetratricopeptide (TPR) repeat protein
MAPKEAYPLEEAATHRALALDPDLADAHIQDGYLLQTYHRDLTGAEREYLRAIQLEPYSGQAHHALALHMAITGRVDESLAEARRAAELEPTLPPSKGSILWNQYFGHRFSDMELSLKTLSGNFSPCMEALAAEAVGNYAQAASAAAQVEQANWSPGYLCSLPEIYAVTGHAADARKILDQMIRDRSKTYISAYQIALVYAGLHETQPMLHWLQVADDEDDPWMLWLKQDPRFDKYRSLPAFAVIEQRAFTPR